MKKSPVVTYHDTSLSVWYDDPADVAVASCWRAVNAALAGAGFAMGPCAYTAKRYPSLADRHARGRHGELCVKTHYFGRHVEAVFFLDRVIDNPNGNEYDFEKFKKLPYPLRLRFLVTRRKLLAVLGAEAVDRNSRPSLDPLEEFNRGWGADRFRRGPDGWPDESELKSWGRNDGDGRRILHGESRYVRHNGRWVRVTVYGGINGMWQGFAGGRLRTNEHAAAHRSVFPGRGRHFTPAESASALKRRLEEAVKGRRFLDAHRLDGALAALTPPGKAATA